MSRTFTRAAAAAAAAVLTLGVAACGDDDDATDATDATVDENAAAADPAAFCDAVVDFNSAVFATEIEQDTPEEEIIAAGEELAPLFATIADNAPEALADTASELNDTVQPLLDGDAEAFNQDSTFETYTGFLSGAIESCDFDAVGVTAVDYAFEDVPATIPAGTVAFELTNASEAEEHEMIVMRKADGVTQSWTELLALEEEESEGLAEFTTAGFAPPGGTGATMAELEPGSYVMVCFIPVGGAEDGPPHFSQGMVQEFTVQ